MYEFFCSMTFYYLTYIDYFKSKIAGFSQFFVLMQKSVDFRRRKKSVSPSTSKRKVKIVKKASPPSPDRYAEKKEKKDVFGLFYTPPGGFCEECDER